MVLSENKEDPGWRRLSPAVKLTFSIGQRAESCRLCVRLSSVEVVRRPLAEQHASPVREPLQLADILLDITSHGGNAVYSLVF